MTMRRFLGLMKTNFVVVFKIIFWSSEKFLALLSLRRSAPNKYGSDNQHVFQNAAQGCYIVLQCKMCVLSIFYL